MLFCSTKRDKINSVMMPHLESLAYSSAEFYFSKIDFGTLIDRFTLEIIEVSSLLQDGKIDVCAYASFAMVVGVSLKDLKEIID